MAADGGDSASFTVRLVNQVMAPARQIKAAMGDVEKAFKSAQRSMTAPSPKRGPLSDWDKMLSGAKKSQALDFAKQQTALTRAQNASAKKQMATQQKLSQFHADHGLGAMALEGGADAALGATVAIAAAGVAAAAAVGYLSFKFAEASVEAGMFAQRSELAIGFLTNNAPRAAKQFDDVRGMAQGLGLEVNETIHSFERMLAMQFSVGKSKDLIKMAADMQAIGANAEEVQRILYAIAEIKSMGTLQKRQERMLQMAGISGQLIDKALMSKMGISDHGKLETARKKNQIGADVAIDAVMEAVMHKTHEGKLGQAGRAFAENTLTGMEAQMHAGLENLYINVGKRLLPGVTEIANLVGQTLGAVMNDPEINAIGDFLINEFEIFVLWAKANWPEIQSDIVMAAHAIGESMRFVVECFDDATIKGMAMEGILIALAAALGLVALAGLMLMGPLYAVIALIGLLVYAVVKAVEWIAEKIGELGKWLGGGMTTGPADAGVKGWGGVPMVDDFGNVLPSMPVANDNGAIQGVTAAGGVQALQNMSGTTEAGQESGGSPVRIGQLNVTVPESKDPQEQASLIGQAVHTEVAKILRQAS